MRTVEEHRTAVAGLVAPLGPVRLAVDEAHGHVLTHEVRATSDLPRWDNSAMDGYAVRVADLVGAGVGRPRTLEVSAELPAGGGPGEDLRPGTAARIMTGAPLPRGADAVVPVERTDGGTVRVRIDQEPVLGAHVRRAGEDVADGDVVLRPGMLLGPAQVAAAASVGAAHLVVHRRPRVAVLSTGSELVAPGTGLRHGQIPDSNSYLLAAAVRDAGCDVVRIGAVPDDAAALRAALDAQDGAVDAIVTSGGVSMGAYDVVKEVLADDAGMEFVQVAMQPGKPQGLGRLPGGTPVFALPGNPVSAFVSFEVFVRPALLTLRGLAVTDRPSVTAVVDDAWRTPPGRAQYMPVTIEEEDGVMTVRRASGGGSGSHLVAGLAAVEGLAVLDADVDEVRRGDRVRVLRVDR